MISRPEPSEYSPYHGAYIALVPDGNILSILDAQWRGTADLLSSAAADQADYRYAPDKWTVKEVIGHVTDSERIFAYRALRIARNDPTPMEGFEQNDYVQQGPFGHCKLADLVEEFAAVRQSTLWLFRDLGEESWTRRGVANKNDVSVRALAYIIAGHELHHMAILREKYLLRAAAAK